MKDFTDEIKEYYAEYPEETRLIRHPIEFDITWRYLDTYLPASGKILEVGAATGTYTVPLAEKGYEVTAVDFSPELLNKCRQNIRENDLEEKVTCFLTDARDLSPIPDTGYDAVLIMGPLYHLLNEADRKKAISQAYHRLKPGGMIFSAFISRYGIWGAILYQDPEMIKYQKDLMSVIERGQDTDEPEFGSGFRAYYATIPEIAPLHEAEGFETLTIAGMEPIGNTVNNVYLKQPDDRRKLWLDLMFRISAEPSIIGASCHVLYVGRKPE